MNIKSKYCCSAGFINIGRLKNKTQGKKSRKKLNLWKDFLSNSENSKKNQTFFAKLKICFQKVKFRRHFAKIQKIWGKAIIKFVKKIKNVKSCEIFFV